MTAPGLIIGAPATGGGKTTVTLALLRALRNQGMRVGSAKVGPDYIDPAFHAAASGRPCINLDPWGMREATLAGLAQRAACDADLLLIEGVMGLFDGARDGTGSTADLAAQFGWPVVLVVDAQGQGDSVAALVDGFRRFRSDVAIAGVICNRVSNQGHADILARALARLPIPLLGCLPRCDDLHLPSRHLGLVQAHERPDLEKVLSAAATWVSKHVDLAAVRLMARPARARAAASSELVEPLGQRIAVASDVAFAFAYPHVLDAWRVAGAEVIPFSPLADEPPDPSADAVYLPGGYPELHAGRLADNQRFREGLRTAAERGTVIYGECGGYMMLGAGLVDADGVRHRMAGLLSHETSFAARRLHLGYRTAKLRQDTPFGANGMGFRCHEFHYASISNDAGPTPLFDVKDSAGNELSPVGDHRGSVMGSFLHLIDRA